MTDPEHGRPRIEVWTSTERAPVGGPQAALEERLSDLADAGAIVGYDVRVWGRTVSLEGPGDPAERTVRDRVRAFDGWLVHEGVADTPFPPARRRGLGRADAEVVQPLPDLVVAAYDGEDLLWVGRCGDGDCDPTVVERLDALAETADAERPARDGRQRAIAD